MRAQLIDAADGEQIVVFPPGFKVPRDDVVLSKDGERVLIEPATRNEAQTLAKQNG